MDDILRFPTAVKHDPAIDVWLRAQRDDLRPFAIHVVRVESGLVTDMHFFLYPELFPAFGLPDRLG